MSFDRGLWLKGNLFSALGDFECLRSLKFEYFFIYPDMENKLSLLKWCKHDIFHNLELNHLL